MASRLSTQLNVWFNEQIVSLPLQTSGYSDKRENLSCRRDKTRLEIHTSLPISGTEKAPEICSHSAFICLLFHPLSFYLSLWVSTELLGSQKSCLKSLWIIVIIQNYIQAKITPPKTAAEMITFKVGKNLFMFRLVSCGDKWGPKSLTFGPLVILDIMIIIITAIKFGQNVCRIYFLETLMSCFLEKSKQKLAAREFKFRRLHFQRTFSPAFAGIIYKNFIERILSNES